MVTVKVQASAKLYARVGRPEFTTTADDLPPAEWTLFAVPRAGDEVEEPDTGRNFTVTRIVWWTDGSAPLVIVE